MVRSPTKCSFCKDTFANFDDKRRHVQVHHHNRSTLCFLSPEADKDTYYNIIIWRASDLNFYCPFEGCDFRVSDQVIFGKHFPKGTWLYEHEPQSSTRDFKSDLVERVKEPQNFDYRPLIVPTMVDSGTESRAACPSPQLVMAEAPARGDLSLWNITALYKESAATAFSIPMRPSVVHQGSSDSQPTRTIPITTTTCTTTSTGTSSPSKSKRKAECTLNEQLRTALRDEYMKRLYKGMMQTLADEKADLKESAEKRKELKAWFEEGMVMLEEADGGAA
ncbi:hypothetical protein BJ508DRAFT_334058 [Ascobolus immersus RN42]|uniref:C2H2-type domain-containing protein n=1 Tax=Ascobolus immersus RN42 TaxID=1160509 RepID=A0A3N4HHM3_ASCIM|nr:hypothetical protein BJ508DRAFT_334058 [Ascobolus immersus RN42]